MILTKSHPNSVIELMVPRSFITDAVFNTTPSRNGVPITVLQVTSHEEWLVVEYVQNRQKD